VIIRPDDPLAQDVVTAIHTGDVPELKRLLDGLPELGAARLIDAGCTKTLLHVATDWPGHFPNGPTTVAVLVAAGADVNGRYNGPAHSETPLHWAASSNDVAVLDALVDAGADIDAPGGVMDGGAPVADARIFAQWAAAHRLVERGARTTIYDEATLGLMDRLAARFVENESPTPDEIDHAFWGACHGGQLSAARFLVARGANLDWIPNWENLTPLDAAIRSNNENHTHADELVTWLRDRGALTAEGGS
jgi:hypothetical protein